MPLMAQIFSSRTCFQLCTGETANAVPLLAPFRYRNLSDWEPELLCEETILIVRFLERVKFFSTTEVVVPDCA
jgi:hypothetical protein